MDDNMVSQRVYESAVQGRKAFRNAYRKERAELTALRARNERYREMIAELEWVFDQEHQVYFCPWCQGIKGEAGHAEACDLASVLAQSQGSETDG